MPGDRTDLLLISRELLLKDLDHVAQDAGSDDEAADDLGWKSVSLDAVSQHLRILSSRYQWRVVPSKCNLEGVWIVVHLNDVDVFRVDLIQAHKVEIERRAGGARRGALLVFHGFLLGVKGHHADDANTVVEARRVEGLACWR